MTNIFRKIISGELPSYKIAETELSLAILDIQPATKGHILVLPKKDIDDILSLDDVSANDFFTLVRSMSKLLKECYKYDYIKLLSVNGEGMQDVRHLHMHVVGGTLGSTTKLYQEPEFSNNSDDYLKKVQGELVEFYK
jgi:histidine triad (HIT) family protein